MINNILRIVPNLRVTLLIFLLSTLLNPLSAAFSGNKFEIVGIVVDSASGKTIPYATISIRDNTGIMKRLTSDVNGKFTCTLDSTGRFTVVIQSIGYRTFNTIVNIDEKTTEIELGTINLIPGSEEIDEVIVVAQKPLIRTEVDKIIYSIEADPES